MIKITTNELIFIKKAFTNQMDLLTKAAEKRKSENKEEYFGLKTLIKSTLDYVDYITTFIFNYFLFTPRKSTNEHLDILSFKFSDEFIDKIKNLMSQFFNKESLYCSAVAGLRQVINLTISEIFQKECVSSGHDIKYHINVFMKESKGYIRPYDVFKDLSNDNHKRRYIKLDDTNPIFVNKNDGQFYIIEHEYFKNDKEITTYYCPKNDEFIRINLDELMDDYDPLIFFHNNIEDSYSDKFYTQADEYFDGADIKFGNYIIDPEDSVENQVKELNRLFNNKKDLDAYYMNFDIHMERLLYYHWDNVDLCELAVKLDYLFNDLDELFACDYLDLIHAQGEFSRNNYFMVISDNDFAHKNELVLMGNAIDEITRLVEKFKNDLNIKEYAKSIKDIKYEYKGIPIIKNYFNEHFFIKIMDEYMLNKLTINDINEFSNFFHVQFPKSKLDNLFSLLKRYKCKNIDELHNVLGVDLFTNDVISLILLNYCDFKNHLLFKILDPLLCFDMVSQKDIILKIINFYKEKNAKTQQNDIYILILDWLNYTLNNKKNICVNWLMSFLKTVESCGARDFAMTCDSYTSKSNIVVELISKSIRKGGVVPALNDDIKFLVDLFNIDNLNDIFYSIMKTIYKEVKSHQELIEILVVLKSNILSYLDASFIMLKSFKEIFMLEMYNHKINGKNINELIQHFNTSFKPYIGDAFSGLFFDFDYYVVTNALKNCIYNGGVFIYLDFNGKGFIDVYKFFKAKLEVKNKEFNALLIKWKKDLIEYKKEEYIFDSDKRVINEVIKIINALIIYSDEGVILA